VQSKYSVWVVNLHKTVVEMEAEHQSGIAWFIAHRALHLRPDHMFHIRACLGVVLQAQVRRVLCHQQWHGQEETRHGESKPPEAQGSCSHLDLVLALAVFGTLDGSGVFVASFSFCMSFIAD
jgi:hypothetical protein